MKKRQWLGMKHITSVEKIKVRIMGNLTKMVPANKSNFMCMTVRYLNLQLLRKSRMIC